MTATDATEPETKRVLLTKEGPLGWLRIDNPKRRNAMSFSMWGDLLSGVQELQADAAIKVIIVAGHDGHSFCAGGDISEFDSLRSGADAKGSYDVAGTSAMNALRDADKPTIALIQGYCLGGGMGIALQCDLRFSSQSAKLGIPAAKRGIAYSFEGVKQLVDLVGPAHAKDILYSARQIDGDTASAMGLVNQALPDMNLEPFVRSVATNIAENAPLSIRASKLMVNMATMTDAECDGERCAAIEKACLESADYAEATRAFMEKRKAVFTGT